ncbi:MULTISPECIES: Fe-S protein assembly co-chaperone HscB [unclassified Limnobacter]|jgi:molecular chaperone HscB|uniref:Fe-S protein assembly co-chaperone HscB n=1 Tax=unclassified Limnobacter TaxID=2630203 RepID=UPI000C3CCF13|nr:MULTISPECIES: Fe-S protein assembly co-chaperone HscB [unclassified Limnobacter]MAZ10972.1 Fe-S protein assembly co-chaperone HscB [Sutterellaceae bacterium]|tara:strand:- start:4300 stop:4836 length:537 start_codon:yes stop_codon:yes gene_type:complete
MADLTIKLSDSDFDIFGLPCQFELDSAALSASYLRLQSQTHPDRFANSSAQEKRLAVQWATRVNEAYKRLQNPMERAIYWCELHGENPRGQQSNLPPALLMQQMEWREALEEIEGVEALEDLLDEVAIEKKRCLALIAQQIDGEKNAQTANATAQALLFIDKFMIELTRKLEQLEDAS